MHIYCIFENQWEISWEDYLNMLSVNFFKDWFLDSSIDFLYILCMTDGVAHPPMDIMSASGMPIECAYDAK